MSEVDITGQVLATFPDVCLPYHLALDSEGHVLVADGGRGVLLLSSDLQLQRILIDKSQFKLWSPRRLYYSELASHLYVAHSRSDSPISPSDTISLFSLPWLTCVGGSVLVHVNCTNVKVLFFAVADMKCDYSWHRYTQKCATDFTKLLLTFSANFKKIFQVATTPTVFLQFLWNLAHMIYVSVCKKCGAGFWNVALQIFGKFFKFQIGT